MTGSKYSIEIVNPAGSLLAEFSGRAANRRLVVSRNEAEDISWSIDLNDFEDYCRRINTDPKLVLKKGSSEVRIKRLGKYLAGGQINWTNAHLDARSQTVQIRASGFLNLFKQRVTRNPDTFYAVDATQIARTLILISQAATNADFGVTIGPNQATVGAHDRTYQRAVLKDVLQDLTKVQTSAFDFEFTYDKQFNTYATIGSQRPDVVFEWPGNIKSLDYAEDFTDPANQVIALGSGIGTLATVVVTADDTASQLDVKLRQKVILTNGTDDSDSGVTDAANAELAIRKRPISVLSLVIDGNKPPFIGDYGIGDYVTTRVNGHLYLSDINDLYRIHKYELAIDEDDNEEVRLYVSR